MQRSTCDFHISNWPGIRIFHVRIKRDPQECSGADPGSSSGDPTAEKRLILGERMGGPSAIANPCCLACVSVLLCFAFGGETFHCRPIEAKQRTTHLWVSVFCQCFQFASGMIHMQTNPALIFLMTGNRKNSIPKNKTICLQTKQDKNVFHISENLNQNKLRFSVYFWRVEGRYLFCSKRRSLKHKTETGKLRPEELHLIVSAFCVWGLGVDQVTVGLRVFLARSLFPQNSTQENDLTQEKDFSLRFDQESVIAVQNRQNQDLNFWVIWCIDMFCQCFDLRCQTLDHLPKSWILRSRHCLILHITCLSGLVLYASL